MKKLITFSLLLTSFAPLCAQEESVFEPQTRTDISFTRGRTQDNSRVKKIVLTATAFAGGAAVAYHKSSEYLHENLQAPLAAYLKEHPNHLKGALSLVVAAGAILAYKQGMIEKAIETLGELKIYLQTLGSADEEDEQQE